MSDPTTAGPAPRTVSSSVPIWVGLALIEALLLGWGAVADQLGLAVAAALGILFFLLSFRSLELGCVLTWLSVPLSVEYEGSHTAISVPSEPMLIALVAAWAARALWERSFPKLPRDIGFPLTLLALAALVSSLAGAHPLLGIKGLIATTGYVGFGLFVFRSVRCSIERIRRWLSLSAAIGAIVGLYGMAKVLVGGVNIAYGAARPFFNEHGSYAAYLAFFLPPTLLAALEARRRSRLLYSVATAVQLAALILSFTRAAWASIAIVVPALLAAWFWWRRSARALWLPIAAVLAIALLIIGSGTGLQLGRRAATIVDTENVSNLERVNRWIAAVDMFEAHPILGVGYNSFLEEYRTYRRKLVVTPQVYVRMGTHSEPLQLLCETGIVGFGAAVWFFTMVALRGLRTFRRGPSDPVRFMALGALAGVATYGIHGLFNAYLGMDKISAPFWLGVGAVIALSELPGHQAPGEPLSRSS